MPRTRSPARWSPYAGPTILDDPAPIVLCTGLEGDALGFKIVFSVGLSAQLPRGRSDLFVEMHRHLRHGGIAMAVPGKARPKPVEVPGISELLARSELFRAFDDAERAALVPYFKPVPFDADQILLREDEVPDAMLIIASGTVAAVRPTVGIVNRLGPDETLGAAGLVTGQPFMATAKAADPAADVPAGQDRPRSRARHPSRTARELGSAGRERGRRHAQQHGSEQQAASPDTGRVGATLQNFLAMLGARTPS